MKPRNLFAGACAALMLATPFVANAATTNKPAGAPTQSCKGLTGKSLHDCTAKQAHMTKPAKH